MAPLEWRTRQPGKDVSPPGVMLLPAARSGERAKIPPDLRQLPDGAISKTPITRRKRAHTALTTALPRSKMRTGSTLPGDIGRRNRCQYYGDEQSDDEPLPSSNSPPPRHLVEIISTRGGLAKNLAPPKDLKRNALIDAELGRRHGLCRRSRARVSKRAHDLLFLSNDDCGGCPHTRKLSTSA
jgi:hypothetical protein